MGLCQDLVGGLGPGEGLAAVVPAVDEGRILIIRSRTEAKVPRWMDWRSMMPNQTSTRFNQDPEVGVKWTWIRGLAASQA